MSEPRFKLRGVDEDACEADCPSCGQTVPLGVAQHIAEADKRVLTERDEALAKLARVREWAESRPRERRFTNPVYYERLLSLLSDPLTTEQGETE